MHFPGMLSFCAVNRIVVFLCGMCTANSFFCAVSTGGVIVVFLCGKRFIPIPFPIPFPFSLPSPRLISKRVGRSVNSVTRAPHDEDAPGRDEIVPVPVPLPLPVPVPSEAVRLRPSCPNAPALRENITYNLYFTHYFHQKRNISRKNRENIYKTQQNRNAKGEYSPGSIGPGKSQLLYK